MDGPVRITGWRLDFALRAAGWSRAEFAERIGVTGGHVTRIIQEQTRVSVDTLAAILDAFGNRLSIRDLVEVKPGTPGADDTKITDTDRAGGRVASRRFKRT